MSAIPSGQFRMGESLDNIRKDNAAPVDVYVSEFHIDCNQVSKRLWNDVLSWTRGKVVTDLDKKGFSHELKKWACTNWITAVGVACSRGGDPDHPVRFISWLEAIKWCNVRSLMEGLVPCYYLDEAKTNVYLA